VAHRGRRSINDDRKTKTRPLRTRAHIIADLSILYFQWIAANCGYVAEEPDHDYGYDKSGRDKFAYPNGEHRGCRCHTNVSCHEAGSIAPHLGGIIT
jgi:hypothetical protein